MFNASNDPPRLNTLGRIALRLGVPLHRVQYIIASRDIRPAAYAGQLRLFDSKAMARIRHEINAIDARRSSKGIGGGQ